MAARGPRNSSQTLSRGILAAGGRLVLQLLVPALVLAWPVTARAYQERLIMVVTEGNCTLRVEADDQSRTLRLRVLSGAARCDLNKSTMAAVLKTALAQTDQERPGEIYGSLFLGRLVDFPWLSRYLAWFACRDPRWDRKKGRPVSGNLYGYVREVLASPEVTALFDEALGGSGYRVAVVTVEKVLVGRWDDLPLTAARTRFPGKAPYDAMVWLVLERAARSGIGADQGGGGAFRKN